MFIFPDFSIKLPKKGYIENDHRHKYMVQFENYFIFIFIHILILDFKTICCCNT